MARPDADPLLFAAERVAQDNAWRVGDKDHRQGGLDSHAGALGFG